MLVLVAVDAEVLPVAAVRGIVVVVAVLVVDGQQVEGRAVELARAPGADPPMQREGALAVALLPGAGLGIRLADQGIDVGRLTGAATGGTKAPSGHRAIIPQQDRGDSRRKQVPRELALIVVANHIRQGVEAAGSGVDPAASQISRTRSYSSVISTRRFLARPSRVALLATGFALPKPFVVMRAPAIPCETM